jgi:gamma-glutamylaminecyclotransferase
MKSVFVYGTLKRGGSNHRFLAGQQFLGEATTAPGYTLYSLGGYPGMVRSINSTHFVTGEVWNVDDACLAKLDKLEGIDEGLYARESIPLQPPFADQVVDTYLYLRGLEGRGHLGSVWSG